MHNENGALKKMKKKSILPLLVAGVLVTACATDKSNQDIGAEAGLLIGTVIGVGLAAATGSDGAEEGLLIGAAAGAIIGSAMGSFVGEKLDEIDQLKAEMAALTALKADDARTVSWKSDQNDGVGGTASVVSGKGVVGSECKIVRHLLNISGEEVVEEQEYCLDANGSWVLQS